MELIYVSLVFQETSSKFFIYSGMHKKSNELHLRSYLILEEFDEIVRGPHLMFDYLI